jgi:hypothetical protein
MKRLALAALTLALALVALPALADPTPVISPGKMVMPEHVIYGRPNKPQVLIVVKPPAAAAAAGAAHESLRAALVGQSEPAPL